MVNKVILIGNLGRDPEIRSTASGTSVANLSLATNRRWTDREGNSQEETEWHRIVVFGRQAEVAGQYLSRGRRIYVEGRLHTGSWEDRQTGETKYRTEIICEIFKMLGGRSEGGGGGGGGDYQRQPYQQQQQQQQGGGAPPPADDMGPEPEDDDIPF